MVEKVPVTNQIQAQKTNWVLQKAVIPSDAQGLDHCTEI